MNDTTAVAPPVSERPASTKVNWAEILSGLVGSVLKPDLLSKEEVLAEILPLEFLDQLAESKDGIAAPENIAYLANPSAYTLRFDDRTELHFDFSVIRGGVNIGKYSVTVDKDGVYTLSYHDGLHPHHKGRVGLRIQRKDNFGQDIKPSLVRTDTWHTKATPPIKFFDMPNYPHKRELSSYLRRA
ncbi:hypothetical protein J4206_05425 [Candidatus Woesearchaeota archaeon]|nr:hypothetical protein [Candidatus Woesearchaeota archaeon]